MPGADKLRRRGKARPTGEAWAERKPKAPEPDLLPATIEEEDDKADAVARLLGEAVPSPLRDRLLRLWGRLRWALLAIAAVGLAAQIFLWAHYRTMHVTSRNAAVRGHLAEGRKWLEQALGLLDLEGSAADRGLRPDGGSLAGLP